MSVIQLAQNNQANQDTGQAMTATASQAIILKGYALSAQAQSLLDFGKLPNLKELQADMNASIGKAKDHAKLYLDKVLPEMSQQCNNVNDYFNMQAALAQALDPTAPASQAIALMKEAQEKAQDFRGNARLVVVDLQTLRDGLSADAAAFSGHVGRLNAVVGGDQGVLASLGKEIDSIDSKISGAIAGAALSGLAVAGGAFIIAVGAIAGFVTAGTSTPLVLGGVALLVTGVAGATASGIALGVLISQKNSILQTRAQLTQEVELASGISSGFKTLAVGAANAASAAQDMADAWTGLEQQIGLLITDLQKGQTDVAAIRKLYQIAAQGTVQDIRDQTRIILTQIAGVRQEKPAEGQTLGEFVQARYPQRAA
ncbi:MULTISPECIES: HBL/NHE enterotoxin family protein [unclassified Paracoccus (in: a-proteobacteria)]|uniref:HBL/NHE enterotoxin family protein n=1 Tax=unclassified Paracoccus (in: a-proteobacteria) TaxID=2688777 RepID=UPI0012B263CF|nr:MULTISPECIES: HBL/NHE enterotoxin family protein [unclassified Paracoccus (in: a-proteobacteria)]UXU76576.1 alpha-helical pore-forming toxin family protein [Paracoccus sp. SMMA_5]UXU82463.1 alpha-helical pore-forming toxin family protein [Paracoccus sp. SMMA_5_TC]